MKRRPICTPITVLALVLASLAAAPSVASAATLRVCPNGCRFHQLAPAIAAARSGDTIKIAPGTYKGGLTIKKNLRLIGAGADKTTIKGGGPVITIGRFLAVNEPSVTISGLTVTGGFTKRSPEYPAIAAGGGIYIPARHKYTPGATVTISNSVIAGNEVSPATTRPVGPPCPHKAHCPFGGAFGGGIANDGKLTLIHTRVSNNKAIGPRASDSDGAGIWSSFRSSLTLRSSTVTHNLARATGPIGRFAEGGGIFTNSNATVVIQNSTISANTASLSSTLPWFIGGGNTLELGIHSGGLQTGDNGTVNISHTAIVHNTITGVDLRGEPEVFDAGFCNCGSSKLTMRDTKIADNHLNATAKTLKDAFAAVGGSAGGAFETDGPSNVLRMTLTGNTAHVRSPHGAAIASGAVFIGTDPSKPAIIRNSLVSANTVTASTNSGTVKILGVGVVNTSGLILRADHITSNRGTLVGKPGMAQGGGVWNGHFPSGPSFNLQIQGTTITHNSLHGMSGSTLQGGGLFTMAPLTLTGDTIRHNVPNNCFGTSC
jgi:hypothetical protein